jgi:CheY-like chemotaxis protein
VLVVDDSDTNRKVLRHQLQRWGIAHECVADARAALTALRAAASGGAPFEAAILDHQMPDQTGVMLARQIRSDPALISLPLILLTSLADAVDKEERVEIGFAAALYKPVKAGQVFDALTRALDPVGARRPALPVEAPTAQTTMRGRVLVAEDNPVNQKVARMQLRKLGCSADAVGNGVEAIKALSRIPYDLVLMDCQMPELDGFEATLAIRSANASYSAVPIVAMTASALAGDREKCLEVGMNDYISKPVKAEDPA